MELSSLYEAISADVESGTVDTTRLGMVPDTDPEVSSSREEAVSLGMSREDWTAWYVEELGHVLTVENETDPEWIRELAVQTGPVIYFG